MLRTLLGVLAMAMGGASMSCSRSGPDPAKVTSEATKPKQDLPESEAGEMRTAVLAGGCFWCTEGVYEQLEGVEDVVSGYAGGSKETADYRSVSSGGTDHAEAIRITYDPSRISYGELLRVFFTVAHDPTQLNRQGPDVGRQYRSAIFYQSDEEKQVAEAYIRQLEQEKVFDKPIVTTLEPLDEFYPAEGYHQDYVRNNPNNAYILFNALPKIEKLEKQFPAKLKKEAEPK